MDDARLDRGTMQTRIVITESKDGTIEIEQLRKRENDEEWAPIEQHTKGSLRNLFRRAERVIMTKKPKKEA